ncbi:sn-glycerol-3-phosphate ABC transporter permease UgpA [Paracoccus sp. S-4012]|uniref:sn-glycerol-3-phosphate ABC transporter permease UgpA n=1 Tax=Paracoccus sp. S-4012 TaxID=2665648 RepID=UPI0012AF0FB9|nr:sn-glycerol-3-phosphate ABC transporter permease UgpA [Paracoccus sp. S-4012]MRX52331.1 sn-glycerol-3-phosphate ABC transporter permease UgpA [Paracoccus sp. S-4012]
MQTKRTIFPNKGLPYLLLAPQLIVTAVFFLWPAGQAIWTSFRREDPFGLNTTFVGLANYRRLFTDGAWLNSAAVTAVFAVSVTLLALVTALILALAVHRVLRGTRVYTTLLVWPYAVAPVVAGVLWWFLFNPTIGILPMVLSQFGVTWNHRINGNHAMILVIIAATWKQVSYNFLFFLAALQSVPKSLIEAAAIDGAGPLKRTRDIVLPLIAPTTFFLLIVNVNYAMFDTFPIIDATTSGGPAGATNILVYKVYADGFLGLNLGSSSAQSVVLMLIVIALTVVQFRYVERKVQY